MKDHETEDNMPDPDALATRLFYLAIAGVIAYALVAYILVEMF